MYAKLVAMMWRDMLVHEANPRPQLNIEEEEHLRQRMGTSCHVAWARVAVAEQGGCHDDVDSTRMSVAATRGGRKVWEDK